MQDSVSARSFARIIFRLAIDSRRFTTLSESRYFAARSRTPYPPFSQGARALGTVGQELGVALVQRDDGVGQPVGGEDLGPPVLPACIHLEHDEFVALEGPDVELAAADSARRNRVATQRQ
jgi:hypothetical protein